MGTFGVKYLRPGMRLSRRAPWWERLWRRFFPSKPVELVIVAVDRENMTITVTGSEEDVKRSCLTSDP